MRIRRFRAPRLHEALAAVREELGPDALILAKERRGGLWEVQAASDTRPAPETAPPEPPPAPTAGLDEALMRLERLAQRLAQPQRDALRAQLATPAARQAFDQLVRLGASPALAAEAAPDFARMGALATKRLVWARRPRAGERILFLGPRGVGKTTLIAKTAAWLADRGARCAVATTDTDRLLGAHSLRAYAELLDLAFVALHDADDPVPPRRGKVAPFLLIDSEGLAPDGGAAARQRPLWDALAPDRRVLVLPAHFDEEDGMRWIETARELGADHLAITHLDTATRPAKLLNWAAASRLALSFCSFGPDATGRLGWLSPRSVHAALRHRSLAQAAA